MVRSNVSWYLVGGYWTLIPRMLSIFCLLEVEKPAILTLWKSIQCLNKISDAIFRQQWIETGSYNIKQVIVERRKWNWVSSKFSTRVSQHTIQVIFKKSNLITKLYYRATPKHPDANHHSGLDSHLCGSDSVSTAAMSGQVKSVKTLLWQE